MHLKSPGVFIHSNPEFGIDISVRPLEPYYQIRSL